MHTAEVWATSVKVHAVTCHLRHGYCTLWNTWTSINFPRHFICHSLLAYKKTMNSENAMILLNGIPCWSSALMPTLGENSDVCHMADNSSSARPVATWNLNPNLRSVSQFLWRFWFRKPNFLSFRWSLHTCSDSLRSVSWYPSCKKWNHVFVSHEENCTCNNNCDEHSKRLMHIAIVICKFHLVGAQRININPFLHIQHLLYDPRQLIPFDKVLGNVADPSLFKSLHTSSDEHALNVGF